MLAISARRPEIDSLVLLQGVPFRLGRIGVLGHVGAKDLGFGGGVGFMFLDPENKMLCPSKETRRTPTRQTELGNSLSRLDCS